MIEKIEWKKGFACKFGSSDAMIDEFTKLCKDRAYCSFFIFNLSISGDKSRAWLQIAGAEGPKDFKLFLREEA
jgi:hypothetical protein